MSEFLKRALEVSQWPQEMRQAEYTEMLEYIKDKPLDGFVTVNLPATLLGCLIGMKADATPKEGPVIHTVVLSDGVNVKEG